MRSVRLCDRDVHLEQRHFWADAGDDYFLVARSLADIIVGAREVEEAYQNGRAPLWENQHNKVTVIAGLCRSIPREAVEAEPLGATQFKIHRTDESFCGVPIYWIDFVGAVRAFLSENQAWAWRNEAETFGLNEADTGYYQAIEKDGF
jgi:uncharacterized membrane protein (UPF0182 family)